MTAVAIVVLVLTVQAPASPPPKSPQDCLTAGRALQSKRLKELGRTTNETLQQVTKERVAMLQECLVPFALDTTPIEQLPSLVAARIEAQQPELAKDALSRGLANTSASVAQRGSLLALAARMNWSPNKLERYGIAEKYVDQLDALGSEVIEHKLSAHSWMNGVYRGDDIDSGIIKHSNWLIETGRTLSPELRKKYGGSIVAAYVNLAEAVAGHGENSRAIELLKSAQTDWPDHASRVEDTLARYLTVGTDAPLVVGDRWLNREGTAPLDLKGKVTLLQFTAHWCGPCKESYPGMKRLEQRFGKEPFQIVFFTQLYGYFGTERDLTPDQETERDRKYFADYGFRIPIAIGQRPVEEAYKVGGIPQINVIDKAGKIRLVMVGYDDANEEKLAAFIRSLLAERQP